MKAEKKKAASAPVAAPEPEAKPAAPEPIAPQADGVSDEEEGQEETAGRYPSCTLVSVTDEVVSPRRRKRKEQLKRKKLQRRLLQRRKDLTSPHYKNDLQPNRPPRKPDGKLKKKKPHE
jgi:hypothetical protein